MKYVATVNVPGYLPMADEPAVFESALSAWEYLRDERERDEDAAEMPGDDYSETHERLISIVEALDMQSPDFIRRADINDDGTGTVHGDSPGYDGDHDLGLAYSVTLSDEYDDDDE